MVLNSLVTVSGFNVYELIRTFLYAKWTGDGKGVFDQNKISIYENNFNLFSSFLTFTKGILFFYYRTQSYKDYLIWLRVSKSFFKSCKSLFEVWFMIFV